MPPSPVSFLAPVVVSALALLSAHAHAAEPLTETAPTVTTQSPETTATAPVVPSNPEVAPPQIAPPPPPIAAAPTPVAPPVPVQLAPPATTTSRVQTAVFVAGVVEMPQTTSVNRNGGLKLYRAGVAPLGRDGGQLALGFTF